MVRTLDRQDVQTEKQVSAEEPLQDLARRLEQVCVEAVQVLRTIRSASPSVQRLALGTASLEVRTALIAADVCADHRPEGSACELNHLGLALLEHLPPLTAGEREQLARDVDAVLGSE